MDLEDVSSLTFGRFAQDRGDAEVNCVSKGKASQEKKIKDYYRIFGSSHSLIYGHIEHFKEIGLVQPIFPENL